MPEPMRIRAQTADGMTDVRVLMLHPMETGFRQDDSGNIVAAHYITDVKISLDGRTVLTATFSRAVSQDPLLHFRFAGGRVDQILSVAWTDTRGDTRVDEVRIANA